MVASCDSRFPSSNPVCLSGSLKGLWRLRLSGLYVLGTKPPCAIESVAQSRDLQLGSLAGGAHAHVASVVVAWSDGKADSYAAGAVVRGRQTPDTLLQRIIKDRILAGVATASSASSTAAAPVSRIGDLFETLSDAITFALKLTPPVTTSQGAPSAGEFSAQEHVQNCLLAIQLEQRGSCTTCFSVGVTCLAVEAEAAHLCPD